MGIFLISKEPSAMKILFNRKQTSGRFAKVQFRLWCKIELDEEETDILRRYRFENAVLIAALQPQLVRQSILIGTAAGVIVALLAYLKFSISLSIVLGLIVGGAAGYWFFHERRETIFVKDLLHGRHFSCNSVIELAKKEAWLQSVVAFLRQVMESAKHWNGTEALDIEALPKDEAKLVLLRGL